jgi:hypothetical protein
LFLVGVLVNPAMAPPMMENNSGQEVVHPDYEKAMVKGNNILAFAKVSFSCGVLLVIMSTFFKKKRLRH